MRTEGNPGPRAARFDAHERVHARLFAELHAPVFRYVHRLTGDPDVAADVAQEAFVRLFQRDGLPDDVRPWLFRVASNLVRDRARRRSTRVRFADAGRHVAPDEASLPDEAVERTETVQEVRAALGRMRPRDRKILLMREEGFTYEEIAGIIGVGRRSVPTLVMRALRRFREAYEQREESR